MHSRITLYSGFILGLVVLVIVLWAQLEKRYIFFPTTEIDATPDQMGLSYEEVFFNTEDGVKLHGWYIPGPGDVTWLWFHGNGGNISHRIEELALFHQRLGINQFIFDYRGYGRSEGRASEKGTYRDSRAALDYLQNRPDLDQERIVYFGRSLGAAVAVELAAERPPSGMILVSPFASISDMARISFPMLPFHWLVRNKYNSMERIRNYQRPVLVLHGELDDLVPISQGRKLYEAANSPKRFQALPEAGHNDTYYNGGAAYWDTLSEFQAALSENREGLEAK